MYDDTRNSIASLCLCNGHQSNQVEVTLMVGSQDEVAPSGFSEHYETVARKHGKKVRLVRLEGKGHEIFLDPAVFAELGPMLR